MDLYITTYGIVIASPLYNPPNPSLAQIFYIQSSIPLKSRFYPFAATSEATRVLAKSIGKATTVTMLDANPPEAMFPRRYFLGYVLGSYVLNYLTKSLRAREKDAVGK